MFKFISVAMLALAVSAPAIGGALTGPVGHPKSEQELLQMYPSATKIAEGVYDVNRGNYGRVFMFGAAGERYHLERLKSFKVLPGFTSRPRQAQAQLNALIEKSQRAYEHKLKVEAKARAKGGMGPWSFTDEQHCGQYIDLELAYTGGFSNAEAYGSMSSEPDGFGPPWEGTVSFSVYAARHVNWSVINSDYDYNTSNVDSIFASVDDSFGTPNTCQLYVEATWQAVHVSEYEASCYLDPWFDYGSCV